MEEIKIQEAGIHNVNDMEQVISKSYNNIGGIVVLKDGKTQFESYYHDCTARSTLHVFSVTKSIISILIGIAIDKGYIQSINQNVLDFFPDYVVKSGEKTIQKVRLKDLLTMTAPYKYESEPYAEYFASDNWVNSALDLLGGNGTIGDFRYTPLIGPDIFSGILVNATGQSVLDFAKEYLFSPLDIHMEGSVVFHNQEEQLAWYQEIQTKGWVADWNGVNTAGWGLSLTPMDMAKIGQLYLNGGMWKNQQVIPAWWVKESTQEHSRCNEYNLSYGYLWWILDEKEQSFAAMGDGGNIIYVNQKKEMVVAIASLFDPQASDRIKLIKEYIEPVFEN
jgi:CubicO group peptidase (beta-lactamase class C family)